MLSGRGSNVLLVPRHGRYFGMGSSDLSDLALEDFSEVRINPWGCLIFDTFGYSLPKTNMQPQSEPMDRGDYFLGSIHSNSMFSGSMLPRMRQSCCKAR